MMRFQALSTRFRRTRRAAVTRLALLGLILRFPAVAAAIVSSSADFPVIQPNFDLNPIYTAMPLIHRLDYRIGFTNLSGQPITFVGGEARFLDAQGNLLRTAPLDATQFAERASLSDSTFLNGRGTTDVPALTDEVMNSMLVANDGRIWATGSGRDANGIPRLIVARFLQDGRPDSTYDGTNNYNGLVRTEVASTAQAIALDALGNAVIVGGTPGSSQVVVTRFTPAGVLDPAFNGTGRRQFAVGTFAIPLGVAIDDQNRPVVCGYFIAGGQVRSFVARLTAGGALDPSFGNNGVAQISVPGAFAHFAHAIVVDGADRLAVAGYATIDGKPRFLVARLDADGAQDLKFGGTGYVTTTFPGRPRSEAFGLARSGAFGLLAVGRATTEDGEPSFALARYDDDGALDPAFGTGGRALVTFPGFDAAEAKTATLDLFGRILVAGVARNGSQSAMAVARLQSNGQPDPGFSGDGRRTIGAFGDGQDARAVGVGVLYTGEIGDIIVGGSAEVWVKNPATEDGARWALARLDFNGTLNPGATLRNQAIVSLDLLDFPFTANDPEPPFAGFDPRFTPARVDLELGFKELKSPLLLSGARPTVFEQNPRRYRFPLRDWPGPELYSLKVSQSHHFGQNHVGNPSQRYALDLIMVNLGQAKPGSLLPNVDVPALVQKYTNHPNFDPDVSYQAWHFNEAHIIHGRPVHAVAEGQVVFAVNDNEENWPVGTRDPNSGGGGNSVVINHGNRELSFYAHMIKGSVTVKLGDFVKQGQLLGRVGNSGSSSGPHLHFHLMRTFTATNAAHGLAVPSYFVDLRFPSEPGGLFRRQWRAELPNAQVFSVLDNPDIDTGPGPEHGPGKLGFVYAPNDIGGAVPALIPPVQVTGTLDRNDGAHVADEGDGLEKVYAFRIPAKGMVSIKLTHPSNRDLDFVVYDSAFRVRKPRLGRKTNNPEKGSLVLSAGTYFLFVTEHDRLTSRGPVDYTLDVAFQKLPPILPKLTAPPTPTAGGSLRLELPLAPDLDGEPVALLLPAIQKIRDLGTTRWEPVEASIEAGRAGWYLELPIAPDSPAEFYRIAFEDEEP